MGITAEHPRAVHSPPVTAQSPRHDGSTLRHVPPDVLSHLAAAGRRRQHPAIRDPAACADEMLELTGTPSLGFWRRHATRVTVDQPGPSCPTPAWSPYTLGELIDAAVDLHQAGIAIETADRVLAEIALASDLSAEMLAQAMHALRP